MKSVLPGVLAPSILFFVKTASHLQKVSLIFFFVLGLLQILGGIWSAQGEYLPTSLIVHRILDIPFAITGLIYGFSTIHHQKGATHQKTWGIVFLVITLLVFTLLIGINLFLADKMTIS